MEEEPKKKGNAWTNFVREWAKDKGLTYMVAIKDPAVSTAYKEQKKTTRKSAKEDTFDKLKADAVALAEIADPPAVKRKAGRPSKYASEEERKEAKRLKTLASNKKKREEAQKAKKEGTMTEEQREKYQRDSDMKVAWTAEMRVRKRAEQIRKLEQAVNKVEKYIYDNEDEFFNNFKKDPYSQYSWKREPSMRFWEELPESKKWKPSGKYQKKAWELFGDADFKQIIDRALTQQDRDDLYADIPNYDEDEYHRANIREQLERIRDKMGNIYQDEEIRLKEQQKGMMEEDPVEKKLRKKARALADLEEGKRKMERKAEKKRRDEEERKRRAALSDYERQREDNLARIESQRFQDNITRMMSGRGRGNKKQPFTSLAHLPFWDN